MPQLIYVGLAVLGLLIVSSAGIVFFHMIGDYRRARALAKGRRPISPAAPPPLRRVELDGGSPESAPTRRAA